MDRFNSPLDDVTISAPCKADWQQMIGNDRVRFCGQCNLNVYNLSSMTKVDAETFITRNEGRLCIRFYRRADGSILTENCPVGLRAIRRRLSRIASATASALLGFLAGLGLHQTTVQGLPGYTVTGSRMHGVGRLSVVEQLRAAETESLGERQLDQMGKVAIPGKRPQRLKQVP